MGRTIYTVFAGRKENLLISRKYLDIALEKGIIDEVHYWNYCRNKDDETFLKSISNLKRTSSLESGNYVEIKPQVDDNSFVFQATCSNDLHVRLNNKIEICFGGWHNTISLVRHNGNEIYITNDNFIKFCGENVNVKIIVNDKYLIVFRNDKIYFICTIPQYFHIEKIELKTGHGSIGHIFYKPLQNEKYYFMDPCVQKPWISYYQYYTRDEYKDDIILKTDDDILFFDIRKFQKYIDFVKNDTEHDCIFANTINNGVCAYYQQHKYNLIPHQPYLLDFPENYGGILWEHGNIAEWLHNYFIDNVNTFLLYDFNEETIDIPKRFSINFFAYKGSNWHKIKNCFLDDEVMLTIEYPKKRDFKNILYTDFIVSHLSFFRQEETGINAYELRKKYNQLFQTLHGSLERENITLSISQV